MVTFLPTKQAQRQTCRHSSHTHIRHTHTHTHAHSEHKLCTHRHTHVRVYIKYVLNIRHPRKHTHTHVSKVTATSPQKLSAGDVTKVFSDISLGGTKHTIGRKRAGHVMNTLQ